MTLSVEIEHQQGGFSLDARFVCGAGVTALFGRSGSGKTTLVNAIAGLLRPRKGRIVFDGETLLDSASGTHVRAGRRRFGGLPMRHQWCDHAGRNQSANP